MRSLRRVLSASLLIAAGWMPFALTAHADDSETLISAIEQSEGLIIRVPMDANGKELDQSAEVRLHDGAKLTQTSDIAKAFEQGMAVNVNDNDTETVRPWGWGGGWYRPGGYYGFRPRYYGGYGYYGWRAPYYYPRPYYGYGYYYYPYGGFYRY